VVEKMLNVRNKSICEWMNLREVSGIVCDMWTPLELKGIFYKDVMGSVVLYR